MQWSDLDGDDDDNDDDDVSGDSFSHLHCSYFQAIEDLKEVILSAVGSKSELIETKSAKLLSKKVNTMVEQMAALISDLNKEKSNIMEDIEISEVKMKRNVELQEDEQLRQNVLDQITEKKFVLISVAYLLSSFPRYILLDFAIRC